MKGNAPIHPPSNYTGKDGQGFENPERGLTIRDYIAIQLAKPLIESQHYAKMKMIEMGVKDRAVAEADAHEVSAMAYHYADSLIAESNKKPNASI